MIAADAFNRKTFGPTEIASRVRASTKKVVKLMGDNMRWRRFTESLGVSQQCPNSAKGVPR
jgi:hypothetical protein